MNKTTRRTRAATLFTLAVLVGAIASLLTAGSVEASPQATASHTQTTTCDSAYGCTPSTPPPSLNPVCTIAPATAMQGDTVTGTLSNIPVGTHASLLFDGTIVAQGDAAGVGPLGSVTLSFVVPMTTSGGVHTIVFVGAGFQCDPTSGAGLPVGVLDLSIDRGATTVPGVSHGSLARTGIEIALYLAIALALLVVGFVLVQEARRRRRRAARRRNSLDHLVDR